MNPFKWLYCVIKGHHMVKIDIVFTPGDGERVVFSDDGKFMAAGKLNHWSVDYENKLQYRIHICKRCGVSRYMEWPRGEEL